MQEPEPVATQAEVAYLRSEIQRLRAQQEAASGEVGRLRGDMYSATANAPAYATAAQVQALQAEVKSLQSQLQTLGAQQARDKKEIYEDISKKMAEILKKQAASTASAQAAYHTGSGWEHVVQPGESLSLIATAYKVKQDAIIRANNLKNPNAIRVGQKLFIPD